jgi:acetyl esterase/lipase
MSLQAMLFRIGAGRSDRKRDRAIPLPEGVQQVCDLSYGDRGKWNRMDIYYPKGAQRCPIIVSVHGGGFVYGTKEIYKRYCMDLARRGFTVVNMNYRLAPKWKFPTPLEDIHTLMRWLSRHAKQYHGDNQKIFMVGDSAGGQLVSQYAAILTNPSYMETFGMKPLLPGIGIRAVGLNCGLYDMKTVASHHRQGLELDYLGKEIANEDPRLDVLGAITENYPPAHITTACHDFLRPMAQPMHDFLAEKGIECELEVYGTEEDESVGHVFHVNILKPEAVRCNDSQCEFFRRYL